MVIPFLSLAFPDASRLVASTLHDTTRHDPTLLPLPFVSLLEQGQTHVGEPLSAPEVLALIGLLARVRSSVHGQAVALDEALAASRLVAGVRPLICVDAVVLLKFSPSFEAL